MGRSGRRKNVMVPESKQAIDQMKYELAAELGLMQYDPSDAHTEFAGELGTSAPVRGKVNWDGITTRQAGYIGGSITQRLVQQAEQVLQGYTQG